MGGAGSIFPTPTYPKQRVSHSPQDRAALRPKFLFLLSQRESTAAPSSLRLSLWWEWQCGSGGRRGGEGIGPQPDLEPQALCGGTVGLGTSDFLGLGFLRASFACSHPVSFTPGLFYCFITFFSASVAKDSDGAILHFLTSPNPKSCCFKQFGHLQRLPFQI